MRWISRLVTIVLIVVVVVLVATLIRRKMPQTRVGQAFKTCAMFRDGTRLAVGSPVLIAGVRVGEISRITLVGNFARIDMRLVNGTEVPVDSWITKRAFSPFGDSYLEILPSTPDPGAAPVVDLKSGQCIGRVIEGASTDTVLRAMDNVMPSLDEGIDRLHEVAINGRYWAKGNLEDAVQNAQHWLDERPVEGPIDHADQALARLEASTESAAASLHASQPDVDNTFTKIADGVAKARAKISELKADMTGGLAGVRDGLNDVDPTIADVQEMLAAIDENRGKDDYTGTLGRLVNDPHLADSIEEATDSASEGLSSFNRFKSYLGLRTEFDIFTGQPRFFVTAEVRARTDKFYYIELEKGPLGGFPSGSLTNGDPTDPSYYRYQQISDSIRFTVQFGKQFGDHFQVRGGLKESQFGFGADVLMGEGRLKFSTDLYGGFTRIPRLKLAGALEVFRSVYIIGGVDDALNTPGYFNVVKGDSVPNQFDQIRYGRDYFLGAQLQFDEADLAFLIRVYGALLVGLL